MVYKGHLYKGHRQLFQNYKGQGIGIPKKFRDSFFICDCKGYSGKYEGGVQFRPQYAC